MFRRETCFAQLKGLGLSPKVRGPQRLRAPIRWENKLRELPREFTGGASPFLTRRNLGCIIVSLDELSRPL
jgi:hypothetical protein